MKSREKRTTGKKPAAAGRHRGKAPLPEQVLECARKACKGRGNMAGWELFLKEEQELTIEAREGKVESLVSAGVMGLGVRVMVGSRIGFSFTNNFSAVEVKRTVGRAMDAARHMPDDYFPRFPEPPEKGWPALDIFDPSLDSIPEKDKVDRAMEIERGALDCDSRIKRVRGATYDEVRTTVWIENSSGVKARARATLLTAMVEAVAEGGDEAQAAVEFETVHHYARLDGSRVGEGAAKRAAGLLGGRPLPPGKYPVVLAPNAAAGLIAAIASAACGDAVFKRRSWLADRLGSRVASPAVTIVDDGLWQEGPGAFPFDDEGIRSTRTEVIGEGVLGSYLYDIRYGHRSGAGSTGNGMRPSYYLPPRVDTGNWMLLPGGCGEAGLIGQVEDGLYLQELMGVHTVDQVTGEFSLGACGLRILKGKTAGPVTGIAIAGTLEELLQGVEAVGDRVKFSGDAGSPAILIGKIDVSGPNQGRGLNGS